MTDNNVPLVDAPIDSVTDPLPPHPFPGDTTDDDGPAFDSYFESPMHGPVASEGLSIAKETIPIPTRILRAKYTTPATADLAPVMVLPADVNRCYLRLRSNNDNGFYVASEAFSSSSLQPAIPAYFVPSTDILELTHHTGPVWVLNEGALAADVEIMAVTK